MLWMTRVQGNNIANRQAATDFLNDQMDPDTGLLDSLVEDGKPWLYTYDQAMAAMAYIGAGRIHKARQALQALQALPRGTNGGFYHRYNTESGQPASHSNIRVGHNAYVLQAVNMYYAYTRDDQFHTMAGQVADFILTCQDVAGSPRQDTLDGGFFGDATTAVWKSTENNLALYVALQNYANLMMVGNNGVYITAASNVRNFLLEQCWNDGRFYTGKGDAMISTDANALGVLVFRSGYSSALSLIENANELDYEYEPNQFISGFDMNVDKDTVWTEGTLQMSLAYFTVGETTKGEEYIQETLKMQQASGGFLQSIVEGTTGQGENFLPWQAVAPTAWFILADLRINPLWIWN